MSGLMVMNNDITACFTVFILSITQTTILYSTDTLNINYFEFRIDNGKIKVRSKHQAGLITVTNSEIGTSSSSMYSVGWNLICYTKSSNFNFYSFPHFQSSPITESASVPSIQDAGTGTVGGGIYHPGFQHSLIGIFHSAYFTDSEMSSSAIVSNFLTPRYSSSLCDYFIGMFPDLGVQDNNGYFINLMNGFQSQNQQFQNSLSRALDLADGLSIQSGDIQSISSIKVTTQRAIGIQLWFKGSFIDGQI